ncbi:hypothetical protein WJX72_006296 [[Myrmecia] bisecta]|uniref:Uncharacterized protein n=1 Tax=[Myrmecia] bisecta TaxID=41462 RepID=A0AAW1R6Q8_9CHLO
MAAAAVAAETSVRQQNKAKFDEQLALHEAAQRRYTYLPFARPCTADQPAATNISSPSDGICTSQPAKRRCVRRSSTLHRSLALQAMAIPKAEGIPAYKAWSYRRDMENASRTGHRLFYSEKATGETRLASDDEYEYGDFLARSPASLSQSQEDRGGPSQQPAQQAEDVDLTEMRRRRRTPARPTPAKAHAVGERMVGAFCRRCYAYNCPLHAGDLQVRPHQPPVHASVPVPAVPCGPHWLPNKRKGKGKPPGNSAAILRMRDKHAPDVLWDSYKPCTCTGVCTRACPCFGSENFCEKYCGCSAACQFRFKGCTCSKGGCKARSCACFAAGRDCDPDLCHGCSIACAHELQPGGPAGTAGTAAPPGREPCANMRLRTRQHKRTAVGLSSTCGWGTFLLEAAKEGDLIGEYKGERIDSAEADRRGKTYDIDDNTYLFNLNKDWVVDARPCGDKLRFANHSTNPNCQTKFRLVDGEHRLAIFAVRDLPPGSELFYDYDFAKGTEPAWYQRKQAATGQQRRGGGAGGRGGTGRKQAAAVDKS